MKIVFGEVVYVYDDENYSISKHDSKVILTKEYIEDFILVYKNISNFSIIFEELNFNENDKMDFLRLVEYIKKEKENKK